MGQSLSRTGKRNSGGGWFYPLPGLGSNLCRPSSLSIDPVGIYFDSRRPSGLEQLLNQQQLSEQALERGAALVDMLRQHGVSKYNVGTVQPFTPPADGRALVLVVGGSMAMPRSSPAARSFAAMNSCCGPCVPPGQKRISCLNRIRTWWRETAGAISAECPRAALTAVLIRSHQSLSPCG